MIPQNPNEVTTNWMTQTLQEAGLLKTNRVRGFSEETLGGVLGTSGIVRRFRLTFAHPDPDAPETVIIKFPGENRDKGVEVGTFEREIRFYRELVHDFPVRTPRCYLSAVDPPPAKGFPKDGVSLPENTSTPVLLVLNIVSDLLARMNRKRFLLVLEDLAGGGIGDPITGCDASTGAEVLSTYADLHGHFWESQALGEMKWVPRAFNFPKLFRFFFRSQKKDLAGVLGRVGPGWLVEGLDWIAENSDSLFRQLRVFPDTLLHGDGVIGNVLHSPGGLAFIDWGAVGKGAGPMDVAQFILFNVNGAAASEYELLREYHEALQVRGVEGFSFEDCKRAYDLSIVCYFILGAGFFKKVDLENEQTAAMMDRLRIYINSVTPDRFESLRS